jgi:hypothetical protein
MRLTRGSGYAALKANGFNPDGGVVSKSVVPDTVEIHSVLSPGATFMMKNPSIYCILSAPLNKPAGSSGVHGLKVLVAKSISQPFGLPSTTTTVTPLSAMLTGVVLPAVMFPRAVRVLVGEMAKTVSPIVQYPALLLAL